MIKRIDLFMPPRSQYQVLHYFTKCFSEALSRTGVKTRILEAQHDQPKPFLDAIANDPPDCTLSFNGLLPDEEGRFFCDMINIPHVACLVDAPQHFVSLSLSPLTIVTEVDQFSCDFLEGVNCKNVLFMPHGVEYSLISPPKENEERPIDVLLLASFIDFDAIYKNWKATLPKSLSNALVEAAEVTLADRDIPYVQAMVQAIDKHTKLDPELDPQNIDFLVLLDQLEDFINGKDRLELVKAIKDVPVHIYGASSEGWKKHAPNSNIITHTSVDFVEGLQLMRKSKIVLNSCPSIKNGAHERIFAGLACGAAVLTDENPYMHENFKHKNDILFYRHSFWKEANECIHEYLSDPKKRLKLVLKGQEALKEGHTWDHRAAILVSELEPILKQIAEEQQDDL